MFYYMTDDNGNITQSVEFAEGDKIPAFIKETFTQTDKAIVRIHTGELKFEADVDKEAEEKAKAAADAEAAKQAALPTDSDRLSAIEDAISELADMLGGE